MAVSRLLHEKSGFHLQRVGLVSPTRWFCSTSSNNGDAQKSSQSKKRSAAKEQETVAVESFVNEYMETHPGTFPKATQVQNEVGGSWSTLKDILSNLKERCWEILNFRIMLPMMHQMLQLMQQFWRLLQLIIVKILVNLSFILSKIESFVHFSSSDQRVAVS
ncbi:hypothetical protein ACSBR1_031349 [Camellia fascicularis]